MIQYLCVCEFPYTTAGCDIEFVKKNRFGVKSRMGQCNSDSALRHGL